MKRSLNGKALAKLSNRDRRILNYIVEFEAANARTPSLGEISEAFGFSGQTQAWRSVDSLIRAGFIARSGEPLKGSTSPSIQIVGSAQW